MTSTSSMKSPLGGFWGLSWKVKLLTIVLVPLALLILLTLAANAFNYSVGARTGVIDKLSRKGVACWTTEGQLALPNFSKSGTLCAPNENVDNTFYFSVPDADVRKQLDEIPPGSPVTLEYRQKLFALDLPLPFLCVRRTQYEVVGVKPAPALAPLNSPVKP